MLTFAAARNDAYQRHSKFSCTTVEITHARPRMVTPEHLEPNFSAERTRFVGRDDFEKKASIFHASHISGLYCLRVSS